MKLRFVCKIEGLKNSPLGQGHLEETDRIDTAEDVFLDVIHKILGDKTVEEVNGDYDPSGYQVGGGMVWAFSWEESEGREEADYPYIVLNVLTPMVEFGFRKGEIIWTEDKVELKITQ